MNKIFMLIIVLFSICKIDATADVSARTVGNTTYYSGYNSKGERVNGTSRKVGNTTYHNVTVDGEQIRGTSRKIGNTLSFFCNYIFKEILKIK